MRCLRDGTYKLLNIGCTLFLFLVEDSNGQSKIVFAALIAVEDKYTYRWIFDTFKKEMETDGIKCFMGDKDFVERDVIKEMFPGIPVYLCLLHTLKTFKREVNCDKLDITKEERDLSQKYLQMLVYVKNAAEYDLMYKQFGECVPKKVFDYFNKNWLVFNMTNSNMNNTTNNRMESISQKIKQVVSKDSSLLGFIRTFLIFLDSHYQERDAIVAKHFLKKSLQRFESHKEDMEEYMNLLTNYSFNFMQKQVMYMPKVEVLNGIEDNTRFIVKTSRGNISVAVDNCQCGDFASMMLPCRHILAVRKLRGLPIFIKEICHKRWTKEYNRS